MEIIHEKTPGEWWQDDEETNKEAICDFFALPQHGSTTSGNQRRSLFMQKIFNKIYLVNFSKCKDTHD